MLLYRSLVLILLAAIAVMVASAPDRPASPSRASRYASSSIVKVSRSELAEPLPETIGPIVSLAPDEWIVGVEGKLAPNRALAVAITDGHAFREVFVVVRP